MQLWVLWLMFELASLKCFLLLCFKVFDSSFLALDLITCASNCKTTEWYIEIATLCYSIVMVSLTSFPDGSCSDYHLFYFLNVTFIKVLSFFFQKIFLWLIKLPFYVLCILLQFIFNLYLDI